MKIKNIENVSLAAKRKSVYCIGDHTRAIDAYRQMVRHKIFQLIVHKNDKVVGLLRIQDVLQRVLLTSTNNEILSTEECMYKSPPSIRKETELVEVIQIMQEHQLTAVPLLENQCIVDIVIMDDLFGLLKTILSDPLRESCYEDRLQILFATPVVQNFLKTLSDLGL